MLCSAPARLNPLLFYFIRPLRIQSFIFFSTFIPLKFKHITKPFKNILILNSLLIIANSLSMNYFICELKLMKFLIFTFLLVCLIRIILIISGTSIILTSVIRTFCYFLCIFKSKIFFLLLLFLCLLYFLPFYKVIFTIVGNFYRFSNNLAFLGPV